LVRESCFDGETNRAKLFSKPAIAQKWCISKKSLLFFWSFLLWWCW